jgi:hypothetical protein
VLWPEFIAEHWTHAEPQLKPRTAKRYGQFVSRFLAITSPNRLSDITPAGVTEDRQRLTTETVKGTGKPLTSVSR